MESTQTSTRPVTATRPAGLVNILNDNPPIQLRDSGFYSTAEASSKHTSGASFSVNGLSPTASHFSPADKTPSPVPSQNPGMSVASMVSPTTPNSMDHPRHSRPSSLERTGPHGTPIMNGNGEQQNGRRESVDSRMINQSLDNMRLGNSPYASANHSTTSIHNSLTNQRNPRAGQEAPSMHRRSDVYQPSADRNPEAKVIRTAPAITGPAISHIARAAEPIKGQAWAFPEEEVQRLPSQYDDSRRSSIADSITSSHFTSDSRLPPGQRRLDDGPDYRGGSVSTEYLPVHHHSMQHKQISDLQGSDPNGPNAAQPYSRTPELRVSHKLAERKRRTEMKELFDQLRDLMPQERGSKASKWEILTKAIAEHQRQGEQLNQMIGGYRNAQAENDQLRRELQAARMEVAQLRGELNGPGGHSQPPSQHQSHQGATVAAAPPPSQPAPSAPTHAYGSDHYGSQSRTELPPLRSISNGIHAGADSMTGVQYEGDRSNGFSAPRY